MSTTPEADRSERERTDQSLAEEREKTDAEMASRVTTLEAASDAVVAVARERAAHVLDEARRLADDKLQEPGALAALLALERGQTDEHLDLERARADEVVGSRDEFMALVSHDIRNMIGGLALSATHMMGIPCDDATKTAIVREGQRIQRYASRMNRLVSDLLDLTSIEAGRPSGFCRFS